MTSLEILLSLMYSFYNTVFQPILALGPYFSLAFFSAVLAGIFSLIYWYLLDIEKADEIKDKLSDRQEKMKEARKEDNGEEASEHMQKTMKLNQELMKLNIKPMIATMIFVALIFPWLSHTFSPAVDMEPINDNLYEGELVYAGNNVSLQVDNSTENLTVTADETELSISDSFNAFGMDWRINRFGEQTGFFSFENGVSLGVSAEFIDLPFTLPYIGGALNWLGFYILIAMPLTFIFRKALGVT